MHHIMLDGIAGSGKTTITRAFTSALQEKGLTVFSLEDFEKLNHRLPTFSEVASADLLWIAEPTKSWIGSAIRQELFRTDDPYHAKLLAHAFALDRAILYKRLVLPAKKAGMRILHERGVFTSLAYQGSMPGGYSREEIMRLPGNEDALAFLPDHFVVCAPKNVDQGLARVMDRMDMSRGIAAEHALLTAAEDWFVNSGPVFFATTSCQYRILSTENDKASVLYQSNKLLSSLFSITL